MEPPWSILGGVKPAAPRSYRSARRAEQSRRTRGRVLDAATAIFPVRGYAGTTMLAIAQASGVSLPTVELLYRTKAGVLQAAIDRAIAGDDEAVPVLDRPSVRAALAATHPDELLGIVADVLVPTQERSAGLVLAAFEGASTSPELAALAGQLIAQREVTAAWIVDALARTATLRPDCSRDEAVETVWALMDPALHVRLVRDRHWTADRYRVWFTRSVRRLLTPDATAPRQPAPRPRGPYPEGR
ncbi:MAG TPA: TetR/AcrR family transcriptional regulator [Kineosporiaceae bacterium]